MPRRPLFSLLCAVLCAAALVQTGWAPVAAPVGEQREDPAAAARRFRRLVVPGARVRRATDRLLQALDWHRDLAAAARIARRTGRPILWVRAVGDLRGVL